MIKRYAQGHAMMSGEEIPSLRSGRFAVPRFPYRTRDREFASRDAQGHPIYIKEEIATARIFCGERSGHWRSFRTHCKQRSAAISSFA